MSFRFLDLCNVIRANLQFCHQQLAVLVVVTFFKTKKIRFEKHEQRYDCNAWIVISFSVYTDMIVVDFMMLYIAQRGNFRIFPSLIFYVNSILETLEVLKLPFLQFLGL